MLKQILQDPHHAAFLVLIDVLTHSQRGGVIRLLLSFLEDPHAPSAALAVAGNRSDAKFVRYLLRKIGREPSAMVAQNLKHIETVAWLRAGEAFLDDLDDAAQHGVVQLVMSSGVPRPQAFATLQWLLLGGKPAGRRAAAKALGEFNGAEANGLALRALEDPDPQVQANIAVQLRRRGIPGVLSRLVELVESPHAVVRKAAREALAEFSFRRYVAAFDLLSEEVRRNTGMLVKKVDPHTIPLLKEEMASLVRSRRLRGLAIAQAIELVGPLEETILGLLHDEDHMVRAEAAAALLRSNSEASRRALEEALEDRSVAVQEAARKSLSERGEPALGPGAFFTPES